MEIGQNDPKSFWHIINKMNNWGKKQIDPADNISPDTWINHFTDLLTDTHINETTINVQGGSITFDPILDSRIKIKELRDALASLKAGKAPGPDGILGEYLKIFGQEFEHILLKLIRIIFSEHIYPSKWGMNFIKPIYKKGKISDPDNYRGLAIGSAFSKLFSIILLKRLEKYIHEKNLLSPKQIGFIKGHGTYDHIFLLQTIIEKVVKKGKNKLYTAFTDFKKAYDTVNRDLLMKRLKSLGINGIFLRNIASMYMKTEYSIKLNSGHLNDIHSNLGLKQGCPLSPMLFNLYIDDIDNVFDDLCCPIEIQNEKINNFLYADDLVIVSKSSEGLQRCLDKVHDFAKAKHLTISVNKSKTMIFNETGKFLQNPFNLHTEILEPVQSFCYLGFDVKCSGIVKHAMNILCDKANKALRPLLSAIAKFRIPLKTSIRLFHTYISPILLYNAENWTTLSNKKLLNFNPDTILVDTSTSKIDIIHRKLLKFVLGVSKSCPSLAIYGETGETPFSLQSYRLTLNFWHRVTNLPEKTLVRKALLENIELHTNWITTVEKLINRLKLTDKIGNHEKFKKATKSAIDKIYFTFWENELGNPNLTRLHFYKKIKDEFKMENYLEMLNFENRKEIAKIRCSDHCLNIEKGRHKNIPRADRICKLCDKNEIETEEHFLLECNKYAFLRKKYNIRPSTAVKELFNDTNQLNLGKYLVEAIALREKVINAK